VGLLIVARGDGVGGKEGIYAMVKHCHGTVTLDGLSLQVRISEHGVTVPSTKHPNSVVVDADAHERHDAAGA
jgi:hypothetical protein